VCKLPMDFNFTDSHRADPDESPSKTSSGRPLTEELQPLGRRRIPSTNAAAHRTRDPSRVFSRSQTHRLTRAGDSTANANATFLTECSFGVAHDHLVQVITDVQPFEPHWDDLSSIDLSKKNLESVARLKEFLPRLSTLCL
jgi:protein NUD1